MLEVLPAIRCRNRDAAKGSLKLRAVRIGVLEVVRDAPLRGDFATSQTLAQEEHKAPRVAVSEAGYVVLLAVPLEEQVHNLAWRCGPAEDIVSVVLRQVIGRRNATNCLECE